ncbi:MAG: cytochrome C [Pelovirga sp.]
MKTIILVLLVLVALSTQLFAQDLTWRDDIKPIIDSRCVACHGADAPEFNDWMLLGDDKRESVAPRMDSYPAFMSYVVWPATGAMMRRLDDGTSAGKAGNMYVHLGDDDQERAKNFQTIKTWLGDGAWNLNRWQQRKEVPGVTKAQLEAIKARY